jgi:type IV pilus assembly protein PilC
MPKKAKDFVFTGKETFDVKGPSASSKASTSKKTKDQIVLNIDEDDLVLSKNGRRILGKEPVYTEESSGFFLTDWLKKVNRYFTINSALKGDDKANFFHLLAVMINSGISVVKSLKSLKNQVKHGSHIQIVIGDLLERVESGQSLSDAMSYHQKEFSEMEIGMVESGEAAGHLNKTLEDLATDISRRLEITHKIKSAMIYPVVIIFVLIAVLAAMMIFVIPRLKQLFDRSGEDLPTITKVVIAISDFLNQQGWALLIGILIFVLVIVVGKKTSVGKYIVDKFKLVMPVFGGMFKKTYLARFARSLSSLLGSGVPIVRSLEITAAAVGNEVYTRKILMAAEDMKQGIPLAENLTDAKLFPPMIVNMVEVGEKTAQLDEILIKVATFYEEEVSTSVNGMAKIIEPAILVIIGLSVGAIVAAIMLPIMQLSDIASTL